MASYKFTNDSYTTLAADIDNSTTTVTATAGSVLPASGDYLIKIDLEYMRVTSRSSNTLTVVRAQEGTSGAAHVAGTNLASVVTAAMFETFIQSGATIDATMGADVSMVSASTYYNGPSASFAAGTWLIWHKVLIQSSGSPVTHIARIWDGSSVVYDEVEGFTTSSGYRTTITGFALVTLASTTTITIQARSDVNAQTLKRDGGAGTSHTATRLTAIKIA